MAPDLRAVIRADRLDKKRAKAIARASRNQDGFSLTAEGPMFGRSWCLSTYEVHHLLTDEADWDALIWTMDPAGLERLALTLEWLYEELSGEFTFEALWQGEPIEKLVSRAELLRIVREGQIGTRARYRVPATRGP